MVDAQYFCHKDGQFSELFLQNWKNNNKNFSITQKKEIIELFKKAASRLWLVQAARMIWISMGWAANPNLSKNGGKGLVLLQREDQASRYGTGVLLHLTKKEVSKRAISHCSNFHYFLLFEHKSNIYKVLSGVVADNDMTLCWRAIWPKFTETPTVKTSRGKLQE